MKSKLALSAQTFATCVLLGPSGGNVGDRNWHLDFWQWHDHDRSYRHGTTWRDLGR